MTTRPARRRNNDSPHTPGARGRLVPLTFHARRLEGLVRSREDLVGLLAALGTGVWITLLLGWLL